MIFIINITKIFFRGLLNWFDLKNSCSKITFSVRFKNSEKSHNSMMNSTHSIESNSIKRFLL